LPHDLQIDTETWVTVIEQFLMLILIIGRWMLPKGETLPRSMHVSAECFAKEHKNHVARMHNMVLFRR
jgi:hypothetical protein